MNRIIASLIILLTSLSLHARNRTFERLETSDGLPNDFVLSIMQDEDGFMWMGTMAGLVRYDGTGFREAIDSETGQPLNNRIQDIYYTSGRYLWLSAFGGVYYKFDRLTNRTVAKYPDALGKKIQTAKTLYAQGTDGEIFLAFEKLGLYVEENDGASSFYSFSEIPKMPYPFNLVSMCQTSDRSLWILTSKGILRWDRKSETYTVMLPGIFAFKAQEYDGILYVSSEKGLYMINLESGENEITPPMEDRRIINMYVADPGYLWVISEDGTIVLEDLNEKREILIGRNSYKGKVMSSYVDKNRDLWLVTSNTSEVYRYDISSGKIVSYPVDLNHSYAHNHMVVNYYYDDSYGSLWFGTFSDGLIEYNYADETLHQYRTSRNDYTTINNNGQLSICEDRNGILWFGTRKGGIAKLNLNQEDFGYIIPDPDISDPYMNESMGFVKDKSGVFIMPTYGNGVFAHDTRTGCSDRVDIYVDGNKTEVPDFWIYTAYQDHSGKYWIGTKINGLYRAELTCKGGRYRLLMTNVGLVYDRNRFQSEDIYSICEDEYGNVYVATYGGGLYKIEKGETVAIPVRFPEPYHDQFRYIRYVVPDKDGNIWIAGLGGCLQFKIYHETNIVKVLNVFENNASTKERDLPFYDVNYVFEDSSGNIWFGTNGGGLCMWNPGENRMFRYTDQSIPSRIIHGLIEDSQENIWITTDRGLCVYKRESGSFVNYFEEDGLYCDSFSEANPFLDSDGTMYFGTVKGIVAVNPAVLKDVRINPTILFTELRINNLPVTVYGNGSILDTDINMSGQIVLKHDQRDFSVYFSSDLYDNPDNDLFDYMLEGYDSDWIASSSNNNATYSSISPGNYILKVRMSSVADFSETKVKELKIKVKRPYYASVTAYFLYFMIFLVAFWLIYENRKRYFLLKSEYTIEKKLTEFKLMFFTNISHELRTILTLIKAPLSRISLENNAENMNLLNLVSGNVDKLTYLVNEILDFRKIQNDKMELDVSEIDIVKFFTTVTDMFRISADNKHIDYTVHVEGEVRNAWIDAEKMEKILTNLLSNALKYTPESGKIEATLLLKSGTATIVVSDTGIGFDTSDKRLFERFHNGIARPSVHSTGIGLSLVREYVALHHGTLNFSSTIGKGSVFTVTVPVAKSGYAEDEICHDTDIFQAGAVSSMAFDRQLNEPVSPPVPSSGDRAARILVVEDNEQLRRFLVDNLSGGEYAVEGCENGMKAYDRVLDKAPDIVISDVMMPEMDGIELLKRVRENDNLSHIEFILLSAKATVEDKIIGIDCGADDYIEKPFDFNYLKSRVNNLLKRRNDFISHFRSGTSDLAGKQEEFLKEVDGIIAGNLTNGDFGIDDIASGLGLNKSAVVKKMKNLTGCSVNQYIRMAKLKAAANMLVENDYTVFEACYAVGYSDINHFRIQFKNFFGKTPSQYKKDAGM